MTKIPSARVLFSSPYVYLNHLLSFFFFNDTATTEIYTLSLHDALPILRAADFTSPLFGSASSLLGIARIVGEPSSVDRKSTRLNSSHSQISYAVFCLKKKKDEYLSLAPMPKSSVIHLVLLNAVPHHRSE